MHAIGRVIRKADKLLEDRRFREAYDKLRALSPWFNPDMVMEERAKAAARVEKKSTKKDPKEKKSKKEAGASDADDDEWTQVNKPGKKKVREHGRGTLEQ